MGQYNFKDFGEKAEYSPLSLNLVINGENLDKKYSKDDKFITLNTEGRQINFYEIEDADIVGRNGSTVLHKKIPKRVITVKALVKSKSNETFREFIDELTGEVFLNDELEISFTDQEMLYYGYLTDVSIDEETQNKKVYSLTFTCYDPFKYSKDTYKNTAYADNISVVNNGTHSTPFVLEATALEDSPYFMVTDVENNHFMIGEDSEDVSVKNYSPKLLTNEFRDKLGFSRAGETESIPDRYLGGTLGAAFGQNPDSWDLDLNTVKQKSGWRGGAYSYSFNRTAQNFRTTFKVNINQRKMGSGKIGQFIYDENNRLMFSLGYQNVHASKDSGRILFMAYNEAGEEKMLWGPIVPHKLKRAKILTIYFRLERIGERIRLSYWTYDDLNGEGRHEHTLLQPVKNRTFNDSGQFYQRKVASTKFGIFRGNGTHRDMRALGVYMYELLDKPKDAKDYIIKEGDMITLDTKTQDISVNGEPMLKEKSFSSNFFELQSGLTNLLISPEGNFDTVVKWRDRYK